MSFCNGTSIAAQRLVIGVGEALLNAVDELVSVRSDRNVSRFECSGCGEVGGDDTPAGSEILEGLQWRAPSVELGVGVGGEAHSNRTEVSGNLGEWALIDPLHVVTCVERPEARAIDGVLDRADEQ